MHTLFVIWGVVSLIVFLVTFVVVWQIRIDAERDARFSFNALLPAIANALLIGIVWPVGLIIGLLLLVGTIKSFRRQKSAA